MQKLNVFESISIDGYFTDADGDMSWAHAGTDDPEFVKFIGGNANRGGTLLFGRKTYEQMAAFWPTPMAAKQMPEVAKGMNAAKKYVASRSLKAVDWAHTKLLSGDLVESVRALKAEEGNGITILGSGEIAQQLGKAGLVDGYQFVVVPIALGSGRTVFSARSELTLTDSRMFKNGRVVVWYAA
jgi:dihydrofolate reductase